MGHFLLCGKRNQKPYVIRELGLRLYSLEELCFYVYNHLPMIEEEFLCEELYRYLSEECGMAETARKMQQTAAGSHPLEALYLLLKEVCYYSDGECNLFLQRLHKREQLSVRQVCLEKAELLMGQGKYEDAVRLYERVLRNKPVHTREVQFYAELYDRAGCLCMQIGQFHRAQSLFSEGWQFSASEELAEKLCHCCFLTDTEPLEAAAELPEQLIQKSLEEYQKLIEEAVVYVGEGPIPPVMTEHFQGKREETEQYFHEKKKKYREMWSQEM